MYYRDWVAKLEGKEITPKVTLGEPKYPWPTRSVSHETLFDFCSQVVETGGVEADLSCCTATWASVGWLQLDMEEADYGGEVSEDLCYACEEWLTYWDDTQQRFNFPNPDDYPELWD